MTNAMSLKSKLFLSALLMSQIGTLSPAQAANKCQQLFDASTLPLLNPSLKEDGRGGLTLHLSDRTTLDGRTLNAFGRLLNRPLGIHKVQTALQKLKADNRTDIHYYQKLLEAMDLKISAPEYGFEKVPKDGSLIVVANHPLSGIEGIAIAAHLAKTRPDIKIVLNSLLKDIPGLPDNSILVNVFGGPAAKRENAKALLEMQEHLAAGKTLLIFPAGSVSHKMSLKDPVAVDDPWRMGVASLLKKVPETKVLPIFVNNQPSHAISVAKKVNEALGMPFILRDITSSVGSEIRLNLGTAITREHLAKLSNAEEVMTYLRARTFLMSDKLLEEKLMEKAKNPNKTPERVLEDIGPAIDPNLIAAELANKEIIFDIAPDKPAKGVKVFLVRGSEIPNTMLEVGRLREISFRDVGEGSGKPYDVDTFDQHYYHLLAWDKEKGRISGAYRLGRLDQILQEKGTQGIYTTQFFKYDSLLKSDLGKDGIELGRSFVLPEYQRRSLTLPALWGAIGRFVVNNPHYKHMIGPVSISNEFQENTKLTLVNFLKKYYLHERHAEASPMNPPNIPSLLSKEEMATLLKVHDDLNSMNDLIRDIEGSDSAKMPPLIPMYIGMGAKFLTFDKDTSFNTVDGFIWVDFTKTPFDSLKKYLGEEGAREYQKYHGVEEQ